MIGILASWVCVINLLSTGKLNLVIYCWTRNRSQGLLILDLPRLCREELAIGLMLLMEHLATWLLVSINSYLYKLECFRFSFLFKLVVPCLNFSKNIHILLLHDHLLDFGLSLTPPLHNQLVRWWMSPTYNYIFWSYHISSDVGLSSIYILKNCRKCRAINLFERDAFMNLLKELVHYNCIGKYQGDFHFLAIRLENWSWWFLSWQSMPTLVRWQRRVMFTIFG